eukprot:gene9255-6507_t
MEETRIEGIHKIYLPERSSNVVKKGGDKEVKKLDSSSECLAILPHRSTSLLPSQLNAIFLGIFRLIQLFCMCRQSTAHKSEDFWLTAKITLSYHQMINSTIYYQQQYLPKIKQKHDYNDDSDRRETLTNLREGGNANRSPKFSLTAYGKPK